MHSSLFFKLFPPPKLMLMKHAGLHISDDAIFFLEYGANSHGATIGKYGRTDIPAGVIDGGTINDEKALRDILVAFDKTHSLSYVKVSIPEEKAYLFQTDVPSADTAAIAQNIEFKLEENVPLTATDAVFYFDLLPPVSGGSLRASVSVVPRAFIENYITILRDTGVWPIAFEVLPKAIARAVIPADAPGAQILVYIMSGKTGIYIVSGGVVCFTSTIDWGAKTGPGGTAGDVSSLSAEIERIYTYWVSHNVSLPSINKIILIGKDAPQFESQLRSSVPDPKISVAVADVWKNVINLDRYVPPISCDESLDYAVAAGLAMFV